MFRNFFVVILAYIGIATWAFTGKNESKSGKQVDKHVKTIITGRVSPADGVNLVWVISGKDSVKAPTSDGLFSFEVKAGTHQVIVDAKNPYKDVVLDNLTVTENQVLDLGEITLKQ